MRWFFTMMVCGLACQSALGSARVIVHLQPIRSNSPWIYGQFLEHIYESVVGGLDAEMVRGRSFEEPVTRPPLPKDFDVVRGDWGVQEDGLAVGAGGANYRFFFGDRNWTDYDFEVDCRKLSGLEGFLVIVRAEDNDNHYWLNLGGWGNDHTAVEVEVNGRRTPLQPFSPLKIEQGRWYHVKVSVRTSQIECFVDGQRIITLQDARHKRGRVGLGAWNTAYQARNLRVIAPDGRVLAAPQLKGPPAGQGLPQFWQPYPLDRARLMGYIRTVRESAANSEQCIAIRGRGRALIGVAQHGIAVKAKASYRGSVWLRGSDVEQVMIGLVSGDETSQVPVGRPTAEWGEFLFELRPEFTDPEAILFLAFTGSGELFVDQFSLYPADTFRNHGCRRDIGEKVEAIRPAFIRWPGGCFAERYIWTDGIGPQIARRTHPNHVWGGLDPAGFGTDEFVQLCRDVGAEPMLVFNVGQHAPREELQKYVQMALDWIEYCNGPADSEWGKRRAANGHPQPYGIRYWELGNETWGLGAEEYARRVRLFSEAIRNRWPDLTLLACGSGGRGQSALDWNRGVLERAADCFDILSVHHYGWGPNYEQRVADALHYLNFLDAVAEQIARCSNPRIEICVSEWNCQTTALTTGLWAGLFLTGCENRPKVTMTCPALFIRNVDAPAWDNALINIDHYRSYTAPNYLAMKLLRDTYEGEVVRTEVESEVTDVPGFGKMPWVHANAVRDPLSGRLRVRLINLRPGEPMQVLVTVPGKPRRATQLTMTGPDPDARNSLDRRDLIAIRKADPPRLGDTMTVSLPPCSVSVLTLEQ